MKNDKYLSSSAGEAFRYGYLISETSDFLDKEETNFIATANFALSQYNDYLDETNDWESSPILPIAEWLTPAWKPVDASRLSNDELEQELLQAATRLYASNCRIVCADHLSNRRLYEALVRGVFPCRAKRLSKPQSPCVWNFCYLGEDEDSENSPETIWLTYYATEEERENWAEKTGFPPPQHRTPPYRRNNFPFKYPNEKLF